MSRIWESIRQTMNYTKPVLILVLAALTAACGALASKEETGVIIARRAQIRSSTAVVAADLKEVVRNEVVDIVDSNTAENGERWLRVRTRDAENTEGWIEARNVMPQEMLERARQLAKEDEGLPAQATGQLRASTNIRLSPDRSKDDNILMKLESGARFDIVGWKRVPKSKSTETTESDDVPKPGAAQQNDDAARREGDEAKLPEETNELWYKVRLSSSTSPAPAAWIYGKQVELTVPSDIIFYRTGREFVAWQRLDGEAQTSEASQQNGQDSTRDAQPGSWVILEKSSTADTTKLDTPDFDRIYVLGYDKDRQEHYTVYRSPDLEGFLPLRMEGTGDSKIFTLKLKYNGELKDARYKVITDDRGLLRIEPLDEVAKGSRKR